MSGEGSAWSTSGFASEWIRQYVGDKGTGYAQEREREREGRGLTSRGMKSRIIGQIERLSLSTGCQRVFTSRYFLFMYYLHLALSTYRHPSTRFCFENKASSRFITPSRDADTRLFNDSNFSNFTSRKSYYCFGERLFAEKILTGSRR